MMHCTKTVDEQDITGNPLKPFPDREYFRVLYQQFQLERILMVEKSRSVMLTWFFSALFLWRALVRPGTTFVVISKDEDRALICMRKQHQLYQNMDPEFKRLWPLKKPLEQQSKYGLEMVNESRTIAMPGKDPGKVRGEHPTDVFIDEACEMENFSETFDVSLAAKPLKIVAISSAQPGDFRDLTEPAVPEEF